MAVYDGNQSFLGGQNSGLEPALIGPTQYATGVNTTIKNGSLRPRPGKRHRPIKVLTEGGILAADGRTRLYKDIFYTGKFQGGGPYISDAGKFMIAIISGIIFQIDPAKQVAVVLEVAEESNVFGVPIFEPPSQRLNQYVNRHHWTEAGKYFVIFDYPDFPIILNGSEARRADPTKYEIPLAATLGAYNQNRLFAFSHVHEFTGGDPVGNLATPDAPITFEEVFAPASAFLGQAFSLGSTNINNPITAAGFLPAVDGNTEIGPLFVATKKSMYSFHTDIERVGWGQTGFGKLVLNHAGVAGQRSFVIVGSDIWFMDGEGRIRSFSVARGDQQRWARTPLDKEVRNWVRFCDKKLTPFTVAAYHNNRIFFSVNPQVTTAIDLAGKPVSDISFTGFIALELDPVSGFMQSGQPAWAGLWTGINPMEFIDLDGEMYVWSKDPGGVNVLYQLEPDEITWDTYQGKRKQVTARVETRQYGFQQEGLMYALKEELTVFPSLKDVAGAFCLQVERRNDDFPNYLEWRTFRHEAPISSCKVDCPCTLPVLVPHSFREVNFGNPVIEDDEEFCNPVTKEIMRYFNETQFRLTFTGLNWRMPAFRVKAELQEDDQLITPQVCESEPVEVPKVCEISDFNLYSTAVKKGVWECQKSTC